MKITTCVLLTIGLFASGTVPAQAPPPGVPPPMPPRRDAPPAISADAPMPPPAGDLRSQFEQIELRKRTLDLQAQEEQVRFQQEMNRMQVEQRRIELERLRQAPLHGGRPWGWHERGGGLRLLLVIAAVHLLAAAWVYHDAQRRKAGNGLWTFIVLLTGLFGTAVYALVRLADRPPA